MNKLRFFVALVLPMMILGTSCNDRKAVEELKDATMAVHDEAMKELGAMNSVARGLKATMNSLDSLSPERIEIKNTISDMEKAESEMMDWMAQYRAPAKDMPKEEALKYLQGQKTLMEKNLEDIRAAKNRGEKVIKPE